MNCLKIVPLVGVLSLVWGEWALAADNPSLEDLRKGIAARDAAFRNISYKAEYRGRRRSSPAKDSPFEPMEVEEAAVVDTSPGAGVGVYYSRLKSLVDISRTIEPTPTLGSSQRKKMFYRKKASNTPGNIEGGRRLSTGTDTTTGQPTSMGFIGKRTQVGWWVHPSECLGLNIDSPTSTLELPVTKAVVVGTEVVSGYETVRIDWEYDTSDSRVQPLRGAFWIAPKLGYALVRNTLERRPKTDLPWREIRRLEREGFRRVDGLWVPSKVRFAEHRYWIDGTYEDAGEADIVFRDWSLNRPLTDEDFLIKFPDGTAVQDQVRGDVTYVQGKVNDREIARQAAAAKQALSRPKPKAPAEGQVVAAPRYTPPPDPGWSWANALWAVIALSILAVGGLVAVSYARRRRLRGA